jgi:hypothetical protein
MSDDEMEPIVEWLSTLRGERTRIIGLHEFFVSCQSFTDAGSAAHDMCHPPETPSREWTEMSLPNKSTARLTFQPVAQLSSLAECNAAGPDFDAGGRLALARSAADPFDRFLGIH